MDNKKSFIEKLKSDYKKNVKFNLCASLAIESFVDENNRSDVYLEEPFTLLHIYRKFKDQMNEEELAPFAQIISNGFNRLFDKLGRIHFIFYDDGEVNYIWKLDKKDKNKG